MQILKQTKGNKEEIIEKAVEVLKAGGLFVFPTETCYGLGADASNLEAINKLYLYKTKREGKPLSIAVSDIDMAKKYVEINKTARILYEKYLPGPLTIISLSLGEVAQGVASEQGGLGVRIPDYSLVLEIIKRFAKAITVTSANISNKNEPYSVADLLRESPKTSLNLLDLIIDKGNLPYNKPSSVVDTLDNKVKVIREGSISFKK